MLLKQLSTLAIKSAGWGIDSGDLAESHPILLPSLPSGESSSFPVLVPPNDTVNSKISDIQPGNSDVTNWYHIDKYTGT